MDNSTTFQGDGKVVYIPAVVNGKQARRINANRFREMSISELAEFIDAVQSDAYEHGVNETAINDYPNNYGDWADWLRQECE